MKIMIMDDDVVFAKELATYISKVFISATITIQNNDTIDFNHDIFFLDIDMPGKNGIEVAKKIRSYKEDAVIVYVSFREDLVFEAMQTFPHYFLRKKYLDNELDILLNRLLKLNLHTKIRILYQNNEILLDTKDIQYLEKEGQYLNIKTSNNTYRTRHSIVELMKQLPLGRFGIVSQGFVANYQYVQSENKESVTMKDGKVSYYSRGKRNVFVVGYIECVEGQCLAA